MLSSTKYRRIFNRSLWIVLFLSASLCLGWADSWESIRNAAGKVESLRADFVQEKNLPILVKPLVSTGRLVYRRPDSLRWEYRSPVKSVLLLVDGEARRFVQSDDGLVEDASVRLQAMQFVIPEISAWLSGRFEDNALFEASLEGKDKILLVPKDEAMARFIRRIELRLSDRPGVIEEVLIFESEDAYTRMVFSDTQVNPTLDERLFKGAQ